MTKLTETVGQSHTRAASVAMFLAIIAILVSLIPFIVPSSGTENASSDDTSGTLDKIKADGVLRVGYGGFPPYTTIDLDENDPNKRVSGFSVDLVNEIADRYDPPLRVEWHKFSWETMRADLYSEKFDFIADPVFQTVPRAMDFQLCEPYSYFGIACAIVEIDDNRFETFSDLDMEGITIALAEGWTSSEFARKHLSKPTFNSIPVTGDAFNQLDEVLLGRADVALNDVPTVAQYVEAHSDKVKALWLNNPPSSVAGGFLVRKNDYALKSFLDAATSVLISDGVLNRIDQKWKAFGALPEPNVMPGQGLQDR